MVTNVETVVAVAAVAEAVEIVVGVVDVMIATVTVGQACRKSSYVQRLYEVLIVGCFYLYNTLIIC